MARLVGDQRLRRQDLQLEHVRGQQGRLVEGPGIDRDRRSERVDAGDAVGGHGVVDHHDLQGEVAQLDVVVVVHRVHGNLREDRAQLDAERLPERLLGSLGHFHADLEGLELGVVVGHHLLDLQVGLNVVAVGGLDGALHAARAGDRERLHADAALVHDVGDGNLLELVRDFLAEPVAVVLVFPADAHVVIGVAFHELVGVREGGLEILEEAVGREVHVVVVVEVRTVVSLRVGAAHADVAGVGCAIDGDERVVEGLLLRLDLREERLLVLGDLREARAEDAGVAEDGLAVGEGLLGALEDLLEVGLLLREAVGVDVERDRVLGEAERVRARLEAAELALEDADGRGEDGQLGGREAVDLGDALVREGLVGRVVGRQEGVHGHPVVGGGHAGARGPFAVAEGLLLVGVEVGGGRVAPVVLVGLAQGEVHRVGAGLDELHGRVGELLLVLVVDVHELLVHEHLAHGGRPVEPRVAEEPVVAGERGEVVAPGVAVALRILGGGAVDVEDAVAGADSVVGDVGRLALGEALGEVPGEAVVERRLGHAREGRRGRAAAQERQLLVEERGDLVGEGEGAGGERLPVVARRDERVLRVRIRLRAEERVELAHARLRQQELLGHVDVVAAGRDEQRLGAVEDGLVELQQPDLGEVVVVERDVALIGAADLLEHREPDVARVVVEVLHALGEGRERVEDALEPPFGELLVGPRAPELLVARPLRMRRREEVPRVGSLERAVAERVVGVDVVLEVRAVLAELQRDESGVERPVLPEGGALGGYRAVGVGGRVAPLELVFVRGGAERRAVEQRQLLGELVERVAQHRDAVRVEFGHDLDDVHPDGQPLGDLRRVGVVVLDERDVADAGAVRDERVVVARQVGVGGGMLLGLPLEVALHEADRHGRRVGRHVVPLQAEVFVEPQFRVAVLGVFEAPVLHILDLAGFLGPGREGGAGDGGLLAGEDCEERAEFAELELAHGEAVRREDVVVAGDLFHPVGVGRTAREGERHLLLPIGGDRIAGVRAGGRLHFRHGERVGGGVPGGDLRGLLHRVEDAQRLDRGALGGREHVEFEVGAAGLLLDELADEVHRGVEAGVQQTAVLDRHVEAVGDGGRQAVEVVLALAQEGRSRGAEEEAVFVGEARLDVQRGRRGLHDGRVDELHARGGVGEPGIRLGHRGVRVADGHRRGVPHFGKPLRRLGEHLADLERGHVRGPLGDPVPVRGGGDVGDVAEARAGDVAAGEPRDRGADGGLLGERREVEAALHRVAVFGGGDAVAARPEAVLAVAVGDGVVVEGEGGGRRVDGRLAAGQAADRRRRQQRVADDGGAGHFGIVDRGPVDGEGLHAALAVLGIHHHHERPGGGVGVEVVAKRPDDVAVGAGVDEGVLLVGVVADLAPVVLVVDFGLHSVFGPEREAEELRRARAGDGAVAAREHVAGGVRRGADRPVGAERRKVVRADVEGVDGGVGRRGGRLAIPEGEIVERHEGRGVARGGVGRAVGHRHAAARDAVADAELDVGPLAGIDRRGKHDHAVRRDRNEEAALAVRFELRLEHIVVRRAALAEAPAGETAGRRVAVGRDVAHEADGRGLRFGAEAPSAEIDGRRRVRLDEQERALAAGGQRGIGRSLLRREHDLRQEAGRHRHVPRHAVVLHERRVADRDGHALRLEVRAPPDLDLRVVRPVDAVDRRLERGEGVGFRFLRRFALQFVERRHAVGQGALAAGAVVEARVPVAAQGLRLVDEAREVVVHALGHRARARAGLDADARRQLDADRPLEDGRRRHRRVAVVRHLHRQVGRAAVAVLVREPDEDLAAVAALEVEFALVGVEGGRDVRRHSEAGRRHVVRRHDDGAARRRPLGRDHDAQGIGRPADEIPVVLEVPLRLHRVFRLPEDVGLPRHGHAGGARRDVRRRDGEDLVVVRVGQLLAAGGGILLQIRRVGVVVLARGAGRDDRVETLRAEAAAGGPQALADLGVERRHVRRADLHDDVRDHVVLRLGVVVGQHELPLRAVDRARLLVHAVADGEHLRRGRIVVDAVDDVGDAGRGLGVFAPEELRIAEELHELAREVDERGGVGLVHARREEAVGARRGRAADRVGLRDGVSARADPGEFRGAARGEDHALVAVRRAVVEDDAPVGDGRGVRGDGRRPVDLVRIERDVGAEVAELGVRRLLGERPADGPRRQLPFHRGVLGRNGRHPLAGLRRRADGRNRIRHRRLREGLVVRRQVDRQLHLAERELQVRRRRGHCRSGGECRSSGNGAR